MPSIAFQPATAPADVAFPPVSAQALLNFVAAYMRAQGLEDLQGVIISSTEPAAADRDKVWCKRDGSSERVLGFYVYTGEWLPVPFIVPSGEAEPSGAKVGELFYNTVLGTLRLYNGTAWTTNTWPSGNTASRPTDVSTGYLYFDTDIGKLLRMTSQGWSTFDGGVGDLKMVDFADEDEALEHNPGWSIFGAMGGRMPVGVTDDIAAQSEGGVTLDEMKLEWGAKRRSADGGARESTATFIGELTINGISKTADGTKADALSEIGQTTTVNLKPPYRAVYFLRKEF